MLLTPHRLPPHHQPRDGPGVHPRRRRMVRPILGVPMATATTTWIPYSEARVFVALAVAMLERDGRLSLDDPMRRHVPELPAYASAVTVRQLIHHTSGLADYGVLAGPGWDISDRMSEGEFFRILGRWGRLGFAPGEGEMYSNSDYALLRILVERVTGGSQHDYLDPRLFRPLGMTSTRVGADQATVAPNHALFYDVDGDGFKTLLRYRTSPVGGISVTTSVDDLVRWERVVRFHRDEAGCVTHLTLDATRVKGLRYTRRPTPPAP